MTTIGKEKEQETYKPPKIKVVEVKSRQVVSASTQNAGNNGYNSNDYGW